MSNSPAVPSYEELAALVVVQAAQLGEQAALLGEQALLIEALGVEIVGWRRQAGRDSGLARVGHYRGCPAAGAWWADLLRPAGGRGCGLVDVPGRDGLERAADMMSTLLGAPLAAAGVAAETAKTGEACTNPQVYTVRTMHEYTGCLAGEQVGDLVWYGAAGTRKKQAISGTDLDQDIIARARHSFGQGVPVGISINLSPPWDKGNHPGLILARRLKRKVDQVWLFTTRPGVPPTNNGSEAAIRDAFTATPTTAPALAA